MPRVADVVRQFGPAYLARYGATMLPSHRRALRDLAACRTAALGGHVTRCDACGAEHYVYHSCRNRSCPTCHGATTAAWLAAREAALLPVPYFHVVFTLPSELRDLVRAHQHVVLAVLMTTAAETLQALAADPHDVGGTLGILAVLHTWTRALVYHPHVHCLVPGGALAPDGTTWRPARSNYLVPVRALSVRFRARFLARLKARGPDVVVPARVWRTPWVVHGQADRAGERAGAPLPRAVRAPGGDQRCANTARRRGGRHLPVHGRADARTHTWRMMTLSGEEFLRRFVQHVLPRGFHTVRYYGLWRPAAAGTRAALQQRLAPASAAPRPPLPDDGGRSASVAAAADRCPRCTVGQLRVIRHLARAGPTSYVPRTAGSRHDAAGPLLVRWTTRERTPVLHRPPCPPGARSDRFVPTPPGSVVTSSRGAPPLPLPRWHGLLIGPRAPIIPELAPASPAKAP